MAGTLWDYKVTDIPEGESGEWCIRREIVTPDAARAAQLRACNPSQSGRGSVSCGEVITMLTRRNAIVMSDTTDEICDHTMAIQKAHRLGGRCLVNGLGLGLVLNGMLMNKNVEHVTVVEVSADVINLVKPHYETKYGDRVQIVNDDAFTFKALRGSKFSVVWHDIWPHICADNLPEMARLHRRYGGRAQWQGSWARQLCEGAARRYGYA